MVSTLVLVVLSLYIAACLGIEIITKVMQSCMSAILQSTGSHMYRHELIFVTGGVSETASIVSQHFGSLSSTLCLVVSIVPFMLTLTAFVTVDSISPIYGYFFFIVLFVSIALMNLVTAVLVEGALANASADKEMERMDLREKLRSALPRLSQIFDEIDKDNSGTLTMDEMAMVPVDIIPEELRSKSRVSSMQEVFEMLDVDGGGELTRQEFVDGLLNLFMHDDPATSVQTLRLLRKVDMK
ncbi:NaCP60E, partial [Symbiodinium necroappetens]